jgi:hypothetical protein
VEEVHPVEVVDEDHRSTIAPSSDVEETIVELTADDPRHASKLQLPKAPKRTACTFQHR